MKTNMARHVGSRVTPQLLVAMVTRVLKLYVQHCKVLLVHASDTGYAKFSQTQYKLKLLK